MVTNCIYADELASDPAKDIKPTKDIKDTKATRDVKKAKATKNTKDTKYYDRTRTCSMNHVLLYSIGLSVPLPP